MTLDEMLAKTGHREAGFRFITDYLRGARARHNLWIVETGCARQPGNWEGDGQSTHFWLKLAGFNGRVETLDLDDGALRRLRTATRDIGADLRTWEGDSLSTLLTLVTLDADREGVDLLYLDSMDVDMLNPHEAAQHALYEFITARPLIGPGTLVAVDDNIRRPDGVLVGKGMYIADYMRRIGKAPVFSGYQMVWRW